MNKIGIVILSRYNSRRLPGKALLHINNKPVLLYIIERLSQVVPLSEIVIATSDESTDNPIANFAIDKNIKCYRGSLHNVAERFYNAANENNFNYIVRINGDNIFVDINLLKEMIAAAQTNQYDFLSNVKNRTYPKGMSIEILKTELFKKVLPVLNQSENYREHVTPYFYKNENNISSRYFLNNKIPEMSGIQLALDTRNDLEKTTSIINKFDLPHWHYNLLELFKILKDLDYV